MIVDGRNSTKWAIYLIFFGIFMLVAGYFIILDENRSTDEYWPGVVITTVALLLFFSRSYMIGKRKLTEKEKRTLHRTAVSARLGWVWASIGFSVFLLLRYVLRLDWITSPAPALVGGFGTAALLMGIAILLDNYWLRAMFAWNNSDPHIRSLLGGK